MKSSLKYDPIQVQRIQTIEESIATGKIMCPETDLVFITSEIESKGAANIQIEAKQHNNPNCSVTFTVFTA